MVKAATIAAELVGTGLKAAFRQPVELVAPGYTRFFNNLTVFDLPDGTWEPERLEVQAVPGEPPFNFATLVEAMKTRGLGRPSTYAAIIQTLFERGYILNVRGNLIPTRHGRTVYAYLVARYKDLISEEFTRELEQAMELIETGRKNYQEFLAELYTRVFRKLAPAGPESR